MRCPICDHENRETARFCDACGGAFDATIAKTEPYVDPLLEAMRTAFAERYEVISLLGRGGMGMVWKAREKSLDRDIALKVVPEERNQEKDFIERFRREARIAAKLRHPRIVSVHEVGMSGGFHYFSMDYIDGTTLRALVQRRRALPAEDAISILVEICRAVAHAHSKGIIHRDLKPENVMVDSEGDVFVMDFGLARAVQDSTLTQSGTIMGSPFYMSPEQLAGDVVDERTDVYSLALILYYCLTGSDLFAAETLTGVISKHLTTHMPTALESIPPSVRDILLSMLSEKRDDRTRTVREVLERLTLRRIVALGMEATSQEPQSMSTIPAIAYEPVEQHVVEVPEAAIAQRRKQRLRSLLDEM